MTRRSRKCFLYTSATALLLFSVLGACQPSSKPNPTTSMNSSISRAQALLAKTRTVCFGRFLIDIPADATVVYGPAEVEAPITFYKNQANTLDERLTRRLAEIEKERRFLMKEDIPKLPLFGKVVSGSRSGQKIVFGSKDQVSYAIHSFTPIGKDIFIQDLSALPEDDEIPTLNKISSHLRLRADNEIPSELGMCIEGGFVPLEHDHERITLGIRLKEFPDVHLSIDAHKNLNHLRTDDSPKLLREQAKAAAEQDGLGAIFAQTKILRQGPRKLNTWDGEEIALRTPAYKDNKSVHEFRFHSVGAINDHLHPELDIRFDSGVKDNQKAGVDPSITDEEALELWDKLISTIRIRKPSDATPTTPAKVPLASQSKTGEICPQTGWWEPAGHKERQNGKRRLVKSGEPMPPLQLDVASSFWQKLAGQQSTRQIVTTWTLVEYTDEPASPPTAS